MTCLIDELIEKTRDGRITWQHGRNPYIFASEGYTLYPDGSIFTYDGSDIVLIGRSRALLQIVEDGADDGEGRT